MNVKVRLEFELAYFETAAQLVKHFTLRTPALFLLVLYSMLKTVDFKLFLNILKLIFFYL